MEEDAKRQFQTVGRHCVKYAQHPVSSRVVAYLVALRATDPADRDLCICMLRGKLYFEQEDVGRAIVAYVGQSVFKVVVSRADFVPRLREHLCGVAEQQNVDLHYQV